MEYSKKPSNKALWVWSNDFPKRRQDHSMEKGQSFQQMVLDKLAIYNYKRINLNSNAMYKNKFKMDQRILELKL